MTNPSAGDSVHPLASNTTNETPWSNTDEGMPISMLPWLRSMPPPSGAAKVGTRPGAMAETNSVGTHQSPKAVAKPVVIKTEIENRTPPRQGAQPRENSFEHADRSDNVHVHLPRAAQLHIIPGLKSALDLETVKIDEQTATIDRIASVLKANHLPPEEESLHVARTKEPVRTEVPKTEWQFEATSFPVVQKSAKLAETAPRKSSIGGSRLGARTILAAGALSLAALYIWFSDWRALPALPSLDQLSSYVIARSSGTIADAEEMLKSDFKAESSSRRETSVERITLQQPAPAIEVELAAISGPTSTISNTLGEWAPEGKAEPLVANAGQAPGVSGDLARRGKAGYGESPAPRQPVATVQPSAPPIPGKSSRYFDPQEVKVLIARGEQLMATGDVAAARGMFLRAADSEDPDAAMALGAAYDPNVLRRLGVIGILPDLEKARAWYGKAERLGSIEARHRLENLKR
jgi:hypothetical protein